MGWDRNGRALHQSAHVRMTRGEERQADQKPAAKWSQCCSTKASLTPSCAQPSPAIEMKKSCKGWRWIARNSGPSWMRCTGVRGEVRASMNPHYLRIAREHPLLLTL